LWEIQDDVSDNILGVIIITSKYNFQALLSSLINFSLINFYTELKTVLS